MSGIFANFTAETCTGTGDTLTLTGSATVGGRVLLEISKSFNDGDPISYALEDSGGSIKVVGTGTYNSSGNTITRNDSWNFNGTVVDDNPSTNITLSGGTHTVSCDVIADDLNKGGVTSGRQYYNPNYQEISNTVALGGSARLYYMPLPMLEGEYDAFTFEVTATGGNVRLGLYDITNGLPVNLLAVHDTSFDVSTTGQKTATFDGGSLALRGGNYIVSVHHDSGVSLRGSQTDSAGHSQLGSTATNAPITAANKVRTYAAMPDPADIASLTYTTPAPIIGLRAT